LSFAEHRTFAKRSHVKDRKGFDMTYFGSTRVVDQACSHSLPLAVAGRHIALNPTAHNRMQAVSGSQDIQISADRSERRQAA
jgi:hypothetical protein